MNELREPPAEWVLCSEPEHWHKAVMLALDLDEMTRKRAEAVAELEAARAEARAHFVKSVEMTRKRDDAVAELALVRAELERLREALERIANVSFLDAAPNIARSALETSTQP